MQWSRLDVCALISKYFSKKTIVHFGEKINKDDILTCWGMHLIYNYFNYMKTWILFYLQKNCNFKRISISISIKKFDYPQASMKKFSNFNEATKVASDRLPWFRSSNDGLPSRGAHARAHASLTLVSNEKRTRRRAN